MSRNVVLVGRIAGTVGLFTALTVFARLLVYSFSPPESLPWLVATGVAAVGLSTWVYLDWDLLARIAGQRGNQRQAASWVAVLLALGILGTVNYLSFRHYQTKDLTEGQIHTLSPQTVDLLHKLDQEITITGFYRAAGGGETDPASRQTFQDLTDRYRQESPKLKVELVDPEASPFIAQQKGVLQNATVFVTSGDREEKLTGPGESDLTNAIIKVTRKGKKTVYFTTGHGERGMEDAEAMGLSGMADSLRKQGFEVKKVDLFQSSGLPEDADVVAVVGPQKPFTEADRKLLADFLARGKGLLIALEPGMDADLAEFISHFGVTVRNDLALDPNGGRLGGDFSYVVGVEYDGGEITQRLTGIATIFPVITSLQPVTPPPEGVRVDTLVKSSDVAYAKADLEDKDPNFIEGKDHPGPLALAALSTFEPSLVSKLMATAPPAPSTPPPPPPVPGGDGLPAGAGLAGAGAAEQTTAPSESAGDKGGPPPVPQAPIEGIPPLETPGAEGGQGGAGESASTKEQTPPKEAHLAVFGDSDFASNALSRAGGNADLFQNSVSYLARETDLLSIRAKETGAQTLTLTTVQGYLLALLALLVFPGAAFSGVVISWLWRKNR